MVVVGWGSDVYDNSCAVDISPQSLATEKLHYLRALLRYSMPIFWLIWYQKKKGKKHPFDFFTT